MSRAPGRADRRLLLRTRPPALKAANSPPCKARPAGESSRRSGSIGILGHSESLVRWPAIMALASRGGGTLSPTGKRARRSPGGAALVKASAYAGGRIASSC